MHFNIVLAPFRYSYIFQLFSNMNVTKNFWQTFFYFSQKVRCVWRGGSYPPEPPPVRSLIFLGITSLELLGIRYIGSKSYRGKG